MAQALPGRPKAGSAGVMGGGQADCVVEPGAAGAGGGTGGLGHGRRFGPRGDVGHDLLGHPVTTLWTIEVPGFGAHWQGFSASRGTGEGQEAAQTNEAGRSGIEPVG
jgi:hypothetical protein